MESVNSLRASELERLYNRLLRYRRRLVIEGICELKSKGLELKVKQDRILRAVEDSPTIYVGESETDVGDLIELSRRRVPSLYRRYNGGIEKMKRLMNYSG